MTEAVTVNWNKAPETYDFYVIWKEDKRVKGFAREEKLKGGKPVYRLQNGMYFTARSEIEVIRNPNIAEVA